VIVAHTLQAQRRQNETARGGVPRGLWVVAN
jgi:hypothetical protein